VTGHRDGEQVLEERPPFGAGLVVLVIGGTFLDVLKSAHILGSFGGIGLCGAEEPVGSRARLIAPLDLTELEFDVFDQFRVGPEFPVVFIAALDDRRPWCAR
jgi:hypothetical protein